MSKNKRKRWIFWVLLLMAAGGGIWWFRGRAGAGVNGGTAFKTVKLERGDIMQTITANGALEAVETVEVGSEVSGKIVELLADYNSIVTNGQVLARLDASTYERELEQAEAELESAKASLKLAEADFRRAKELRSQELISQADFDQSEATLAQAKATLRLREASLSKVKVDLEKTTILSPMDGVVISREVDVGQTVAASLNAPTLFTLARDLRDMRIEAEISEADVGGVNEGQTVTFQVDAYPQRVFTGTVSQVRFEPVTVENVVNYIAMVDVNNRDMKLLPGMTANATVETACRQDVLRLPNAALRFRPSGDMEIQMPEPPAPPEGMEGKEAGGEEKGPPPGPMDMQDFKMVYVEDDTGALCVRPVRLGISDGSWTEVSGPELQEGDLIVTGVLKAEDIQKKTGTEKTSPFMPTPPKHSSSDGPPPSPPGM